MKLRKQVLVWEAPVRAIHWANAVCITLLFATGMYIANPLPGSVGEAYQAFSMGWIRYVHFTTAFVFLAIWLFRIYWFFAGNEHAKNIFRFWSLDAWKSVGRHIQSLISARPEMNGEMPGSDQLARMAHGLLFTAVVWMILTGFTLYGDISPTHWSYPLTRWLQKLMGSGRIVTMSHHMVAWFFPVWLVAHLYQVFRTDKLTGQGLVSSMITGYYHVLVKAGTEEQSGGQMAGD